MRLAISLALLLALPAAAHAQTGARAPEPSEAAGEAEAGETPSRASSEAAPSERAASESAREAGEAAASETAGAPLTLDPPGVWPPDRSRPPIYETWWFWTAIGVITLGVTLAIVVGVTTEHPKTVRADLRRADASPASPSVGLVLPFE